MNTIVLIGCLDAMNMGLRDSLREEGIAVFQSDDTQHGIAECLKREPSLAFVEVDSPANDNFEVLCQLRSSLARTFPIVAVCNHYGRHTNELCLEMGADFTIPQTDDRVNVRMLVRGLLERRRADLRTAATAPSKGLTAPAPASESKVTLAYLPRAW